MASLNDSEQIELRGESVIVVEAAEHRVCHDLDRAFPPPLSAHPRQARAALGYPVLFQNPAEGQAVGPERVRLSAAVSFSADVAQWGQPTNGWT